MLKKFISWLTQPLPAEGYDFRTEYKRDEAKSYPKMDESFRVPVGMDGRAYRQMKQQEKIARRQSKQTKNENE